MFLRMLLSSLAFLQQAIFVLSLASQARAIPRDVDSWWYTRAQYRQLTAQKNNTT